MKAPFYLACICFLLLASNLSAQVIDSSQYESTFGKSIFVNSICGAELDSTPVFQVRDDKFDAIVGLLSDEVNHSYMVDNFIVLEADRTVGSLRSDNFTVTIPFRYTLYFANGDSSSYSDTLGLAYSILNPFTWKKQLNLHNAHMIKLWIDHVEIDDTLNRAKIIDLLKLSLEIQTSRSLNFDCQFTPSSISGINYNTGTAEVSVNMPVIPGALEYDLEYMYVDYYNTNLVDQVSGILNQTNLDEQFRFDCSRITVKDPHYSFHAMYPKGFLVFRYKGVSYDNDLVRISTLWSATNSSSCVVTLPEIDGKINWRSEWIFAEEGKKSEACEFYDGSLLLRQSKSYDWENSNSLVTETYYDKARRAVGNSLTAPYLSDQSMKFIPGFNKRNASNYAFDTPDLNLDQCNLSYDDFVLANYGSELYFGTQNGGLGSEQYVPKSLGFSFMQSLLSGDDLDRPIRSGSYGHELALGSPHNSQYFYGKASSEEVVRLFGSDVSLRDVYSKDVVMDPNGQLSVTCKNPDGKVVYTAMAGQTPSNMESIGHTPTSLHTTLFKQDPSLDAVLNSTSAFVVTTPGTYNFTYSLAPLVYSMATCLSDSNLCFDCLYTTNINVRDECGVLTSKSYANFTLNQLWQENSSYYSTQLNCETTNGINTQSFSVSITKPGTYYVDRNTVVSEDAINFFGEKYRSKLTCVSAETILAEVTENNPIANDCEVDCELCSLYTNSKSDFITNYRNKLNPAALGMDEATFLAEADIAYDEFIEQCENFCGPEKEIINTCEEIVSQLKSDVSLGGQYFTYSLGPNGYVCSDHSSVLYGNPAPYTDPSLNYINEDGSTTVLVNGVMYKPNDLSLEDFVNNFQESWAITLLAKHPEYGLYRECTEDAFFMNSVAFADKLAAQEECPSNEDFNLYFPGGLYFPQVQGTSVTYYGQPYVCDKFDPVFGLDCNSSQCNPIAELFSNDMISFTDASNQVCVNGMPPGVASVAIALALQNAGILKINDFEDLCSHVIDELNCGLDRNYFWNIYKSIYLQKRAKYLWRYLGGPLVSNLPMGPYQNLIDYNFGKGNTDLQKLGYHNCDNPPYSIQCGYLEGKTPRSIVFSPVELSIGSTSSPTTALQNVNTDFCAQCVETCSGYIPLWEQELSQCPDAGLNAITELYQVCLASCNPNNPLGASAIPANMPTGFTSCVTSTKQSFKEVFDHYYTVMQTNYPNLDKNVCNDLMITFPYAPDVPIVEMSSTVNADVPVCVCDRIIQLQNLWGLYRNANKVSLDLSFKEFCLDFLQLDIGSVEFDYLLYQCQGIPMLCSAIPEPFELPELLRCKNCVGCSDINGAIALCKQLYPFLDETDAQDQPQIAQFLNYTLKLQYNWQEYSDYLAAQCPSTASNQISCGELSRVFNIYTQLSNNNTIPLAFYLNKEFSVTYDVTEWVNRLSNCGVSSTILSNYSAIRAVTFDAQLLHDAIVNYISYHAKPNDVWTDLIAFLFANYLDNSLTNWFDDAAALSLPAPLFLNYSPICFNCPGIAGGFSFDSGYLNAFLVQYLGILQGNMPPAFAIEFANYLHGQNSSYSFEYYYGLILFFTEIENNDCAILSADIAEYIALNDPSLSFTEFENMKNNCVHTEQEYNEWLKSCGFTTTELLCYKSNWELEVNVPPCNAAAQNDALESAQAIYKQYIDSKVEQFKNEYRSHCQNSLQDLIGLDYLYDEYNFTLYYYDQAGNLIRTIPPAGVVPLTQSEIDDVVNSTATVIPDHDLATTYEYNSLNGVVKQITPDAGTSTFYYSRLGQVVYSQDAKQAANSQYMETVYDNLGRVIRISQVKPDPQYAGLLTQNLCLNKISLEQWQDPAYPFIDRTLSRFITENYYDESAYSLSKSPENLMNRLSSSRIKATVNDQDPISVHYSYDLMGNVKWLMQYNPFLKPFGTGYKLLEYQYDLLSGKVNEVRYQTGMQDQFIHRYFYDANNRLRKVETGTDGYHFDTDASYAYYKYGPLARTVLGRDAVQGIDYAYTLQGWLKGINSSVLDPNHDMGHDGQLTSNHQFVGRDAFSMSIHYFDMDYSAVGTQPSFEMPVTTAKPSPDLYNGNIHEISLDIDQINPKGIAYWYKYDQLNRLKALKPMLSPNLSNWTWDQNSPVTGQWEESNISYDGSGNIRTYKRKDDQGNVMDDLTYHYDEIAVAGPHARNKLLSNRLDFVGDAIPGQNQRVLDIKDQTNLYNYSYDANGNLSSDYSEGIGGILWTMNNKVQRIYMPGKATQSIDYFYDPMGNRVAKLSTLANSTQERTIYIRDAQGNIMCTYRIEDKPNGESCYTVDEFTLYGSSRLGVVKASGLTQICKQQGSTLWDGGSPLPQISCGLKYYELTNHLGNVMAVISDRKFPVDIGGMAGDEVVDYYNPETVSATDYYPFGAPMPGRSFNSEKYRFSFNGKEHEDEIKGTGNSLDFGARLYDSRIGRWLSVDKRFKDYVPFSPFNFTLNNPIYLSDADGNVVVDAHGREVKISIAQAKDGTATATYEFAKGTSQAVIDNFNANGGKVISTLIQVSTGLEQVQKVIESQDKILTNVISSDKGSPVYLDNGLVLGATRATEQRVIDDDGNPTSQIEQIIKVSIYESSIDQALKNTKNPELVQDQNSPGNEFESNNLTREQRDAAVAAHEYEHATNPVDSKLIKENKELRKADPQHKVAYGKGTQVAKEFGDKNKKK